MKAILIVIVLCSCSIQGLYSQEEDGVVALTLPIRNSLTFNRFALNPTFSFVREQSKYLSISNKREWVQFEDAPLTYLIGYSGRFGENIGAGLSVFQQNYGVLTTFGGILNFAYNAQIGRDVNLTFGLNVGAYKSGVNTANVVTNFEDPALKNVPSNFLLSVNPGINFGTEFLDFGVSVNNLALYNFESSEMIQDNPEQGIQVHAMYTGYMDSSGFFDESKFSGLIRSEFKTDETIISALAMITVPKGIWAQVGYNSVFGASGGLGINLTTQIAIEYNFETTMGDISAFGPSHEITLAYRFKNKKNYYYSNEDEISGLISGKTNKRRVVKANKPKRTPKKVNSTVQSDAEANAKLLAEQKAKADTDTKAKRIAEQKAKEEAAVKAKLIEDQKAKAEEAQRAKEIAETRARLAVEQKAKEEAEARAKLIEAQKEKLAAEQKAKEEAEARAQEIEAQKAKDAAAERARALAEQEAIEKAEEDAKRLAEQKAEEAKQLEEEKAIEADKAEAKRLEEQQAKLEADRLAQLKTEADEKQKAEAQAKLIEAQEAAKKAEEDALFTNPKDEIGKSMLAIVNQTETSREAQNELLNDFDAIVAIKDKDLKDLKEENDLSDQGIAIEPRPFKSVTAENNRLREIQLNLEKTINTRSEKINELKLLYNDNKKAQNNEIVNSHYKSAIAQLEAEQTKAKQVKVQLENKLESIRIATEFEKRRRIKRAAFDNEEDRYGQDRAILQNIKRTTKLSDTLLNEDDFDFGEEQGDNIKILKNINNVENGYYLIIAVHNDINKRNEFVTKVVASGRTDVDFFYDVNTSKYYIYYSKFDFIEEATEAIKTKGDRPYNGKMSIVKIEN